MASQYKVVFRLEGPEKNNHHLDLSVLVRKIKEFQRFLQSTAKGINEDDATFRVTHIAHDSPMEMACELTSKNQEGVNAVFQSVGKI